MNRVYVLGSGFSRAISNGLPEAGQMPTLKELSQAVLANLDAKRVPPIPGRETPVANDFEQWLSYLIESPPWLTPGQQQQNLGAFFDVSRAVHEVLTERQMVTVRDSGSCPKWLTQLVTYWEKTAATVITFNYDQLVELAWRTNQVKRENSLDLFSVPLTPLVSRIGRGFTGGPDRRPGMTLLKLHGSLGWWYSGPDSPPGDVIYDRAINGRTWNIEGIGPSRKLGGDDKLAADLEPMIVPPAAVKSPYYSNRTMKAQWKFAAEALAAADELVIIGFSIPATDMLVGALLSTNFLLTEASTIVPVDYGDAVIERLRATFGLDGNDDPALVTTYAGLGNEAIPRWVEGFANID